jgi:hypothetical protein
MKCFEEESHRIRDEIVATSNNMRKMTDNSQQYKKVTFPLAPHNNMEKMIFRPTTPDDTRK